MSFRFADVEIRPAERAVLRAGEHLRLGGRAFDLLIALLDRRDRVVSKSELMDLVWPRLVVEENNLQVQVLTLRKLLGPHVIATVPGRGYRFTASLESAAPAAGTVATPPSSERSQLIGRERDLGDLLGALRAHRLVTLLGAGGVGKSTLARHASAALEPAFDDGVAWIDLTPLTDASAVVEAVVTATRSTLPRGDRLPALAAALRPQHALLVIDNAEHLVDEVIQVAQVLHDAAPRLHLLVTSQVPLRLRAEQLIRLEPLALADPDDTLDEAARSPAVQLFVERVRASDRHFVLDDVNRAAVVGLTRRLDGLPLAIEMAAARVPALSPAQLDEALRERFRVLTRGDPLAPARQHTLHAAMQWTHGLLSPAEQAVFRRLAVFVGGFSLPAAQQVCRDDDAIDEWQVLDALAVLVDRSLVTPPVNDPPRYRLLDTPHAFARQQLAASHEEACVRRRHLDFYLSYFEDAFEDHLWARRPVSEQLERSEADGDNGLSALGWAVTHDPAAAVALAPGLAQSLAYRHADRFNVLGRTRPLLHEDMPAAARARWQLSYAQFWGPNNLQRSRPHARAAADLFCIEGHLAGEYRAQAVLASMLEGVVTEGSGPALARMTELEDPAWPAELRFLRLYVHATHLSAASRYEEALEVGQRCMDLIRESGRRGRLIHDMSMMYLEITAGRHDDAISRGLAAVQRLRERVRHAHASGAELLLLCAWLLKGDSKSAREIAPAVWTAACAFDMQAPTAEVLSLLAARESRPRAAMLLQGYAQSVYLRDKAQRLLVYRRIGNEARSLASVRLDEQAIAALQERGHQLREQSVAALAFAREDVPT